MVRRAFAEQNMSELIETDVVIVGAGPAGLFAVFELGLLDIRCHLVDILPQAAANAASFIPKNRSMTFRAIPTITGQGIVDNLLKQIEPFHPTFHFGDLVEGLEVLGTKDAPRIHRPRQRRRGFRVKAVIVAAGGGSFQPRSRRSRASTPMRASRCSTPSARWRRFATGMS